MPKLHNSLPKHAISLETIFLKECSFQRKTPLHSPATLVGPNFDMKTEYTMISDNKFRAYFSFFTVAPTNTAENSIIDFKIVFETIFTIADILPSKETMQSFLESSGLILIWPYFRQTLMDFTVKLGLPPLILPLLNVEKAIEELYERQIDKNTKT